MEPLVSVVIPSYNCSAFILEALQSVYNQSYPHLEIIIHDDGSSDDSKEKIAAYFSEMDVCHKFENISLKFRSQNLGAHITLNQTIGQATGKYIAILNSDDYFDSNRISTIIEAMEHENAKFAFSNVEVVDNNSNICSEEKAKAFLQNIMDISSYPCVSYGLIVKNNAISTGNFVFTKELFNRLRGFQDYRYIHDWDFILRACLYTEPLFINNTNYYYRLHETNSFRQLENVAYQESSMVISAFFKKVFSFKSSNKNITVGSMFHFIHQHSYLKKLILDGAKYWLSK